MKWCVSFPDEEMLIVRPCLVAICMGNRPAAKLLSVLLYRYSVRKEHKEDAENINDLKASKGQKPDQDTTFRIYRKQAQLVNDMCGEIVEKTLHDVAVPTLQLLGYLDVDESPSVHCYDVHLDLVTEALEIYKQGTKQLETFLVNHLQLEKFLIDMKLEKFPINKKSFQLALEKVLIANRKISNNKRGRKPSLEAARKGKKSEAQITREILEESNRDITVAAASSSDDSNTAASFSVTQSVTVKDNPPNGQPTNSSPVPQPSQDAHTEAPHSLEAKSDTDLPTNKKKVLNAKTDAPPKSKEAVPPIASTTRKPTQPKPTSPTIVLSAEEQAFYDLYCSMPWIKVAPEITAKLKEYCGKLAPHLKTQEQLYSLKRFMNGKDFFRGKGFNLPLVMMALNDWATTQEPVDLEEKRKDKPTDAKSIIEAMTANSSYQTLQFAPRPERKAQ